MYNYPLKFTKQHFMPIMGLQYTRC